MQLKEIQSNFRKALLNNSFAADITVIVENGIPVQNRLQIYSNNFLSTLGDSLKKLYPTIFTLVGEEFFQALGVKFSSHVSSSTWDLNDTGEKFPNFLRTVPLDNLPPYLCEASDFEWAYHEVFQSSVKNTLDLEKLKLVSAENYANLKFSLNNTAKLLSFNFPITKIWQFCQTLENQNETLNIDNKAEYILMIRRPDGIKIDKLSIGGFELLKSLQAGNTLRFSFAAALKIEPTLAVQDFFQYHLLNGTFMDF